MSSFLARIRSASLHRRRFSSASSILSPGSTAPLTSYQKTRAALSLLKSESNPEKIIDICRAASLTPDSHLDRVAFSVAVSKLSDSKYYTGIRSYLEDLKSRPDLRNERFAAHAIVLYGQAGLLPDAIQTFKDLDRLGIPRTIKSLNALLFACLVSKEHQELKRIYLEFPKTYDFQPDLDTYNTVIKSFCESGSSSSAYSILAEMERKQVKADKGTFGILIAGFYKEEKFDEVGNVMNMMKKYDIHPGISIYNVRIQSLCKLKRSAEAKALFDGLVSRGVKPNVASFTHLIHGFSKEGKLEDAKKLFRNMVVRGYKPDSDCYFTLVYYLCKGEDFESALEIYKESAEKNWIPNFGTMKLLVSGLVKLSKVDEARSIIGLMKEKFPKNVGLWEEVEAGLPQ
uniref:Pentatricopeptide repeat-containing protein n=1 Tax=Kalanchoe fedtschenkoi TaxID=63787 RepID=A0A7N0TQ54_KALFE